jgi:CMP-N-acetylneuraminic acid synthetase
MRIVAVVPIKLNNERLPGKNTKLLGGKPLIQYILESLNAVAEIDEKYVYCSDRSVCDYLIEGIRFLQRPDYLDLPTSNFSQIFAEFSSLVKADIYVYAHATAPFVRAETIRKGIQAVASGAYDSAFCAERLQDFIWHQGEPLNFQAENIPRSQDLPVYYRETSGVYVFNREVFEQHHRRIGRKPLILEVGYREAVDINTPQDFQLAECLLHFREGDPGEQV